MHLSTHNPEIHAPWNKGKLVGQKPPFKLREVWEIRIRLQLSNAIRELALFNLAIDSKLRGCDLVQLRVRDVAHGHSIGKRAIVMQQKTHQPLSSGSHASPINLSTWTTNNAFDFAGGQDAGNWVVGEGSQNSCGVGANRGVTLKRLDAAPTTQSYLWQTTSVPGIMTRFGGVFLCCAKVWIWPTSDGHTFLLSVRYPRSYTLD